MNGYDHDVIVINGQDVQLKAILDQSEKAISEFESDTFSFIREWFGETQTFQFQTSGSTGAPKKITFTRDQLTQSAKATIQAFDLTPSDTSLICLSTKFVAGKMMLVRSFVNNMKIVMVEPSSNPLDTIDATLKIDFVALVPLQMEIMLDKNLAIRLNEIKTIIIGGAPMSSPLRNRIKEELSNGVYATYGMTETITHIAFEKIGRDDFYRVLPGVKISVDERQCLVIKTSFLNEAVKTNDIVEVISQSTFRWLGRWDNAINSGGVKIFPELIEEKIQPILDRLNIHNRYFIGGIPSKLLGTQLILFIEGQPFDSVLREEIRASMSEILERFEVPREICFLNRFNETPTGKINRVETAASCKKQLIGLPFDTNPD